MGKVINYDAIEAARLTDTGENNDLNYLKSNGPRALPTSPTANNWSAEAIKKQLYKQPEIIFAWVKELGDAVYQFASDVDDIFDDIEAEEIVHKTGAETISGKKTFSGGAEFTQKADFTGAAEFSGGAIFNTTNVSFGSGGSDNAQTLHVYYTTLLHGPVVSNTIIPGNSGFPFGTSDNRWHTGYFANLNLSGKFVKGSYEYQLPEKSGTFAMTSDLETKADLVNGKVPAEQLPSYVDDVLEYANYSSFPVTGETGKIYVDKYTGYTYRWGGSGYVQVGGQDLSDYYTKSQTDSAIDADVAALSGQVADGTVVAGKASKDASGNPITSTYATKTEAAALESKILAVDDKVNYAIEAITKKDLYETQEATFQGMTPVPAGAMVKAYLDGFKGNSAVVNQIFSPNNLYEQTTRGIQFTKDTTTNTIKLNGTCDTAFSDVGISTAYDLPANHEGLYCIKLISGSVDISNRTTTNVNGGWKLVQRYPADLANFMMPTSVGQMASVLIPTANYLRGIAFSCDVGVTFNNAVFQIQMVDTTIVPLTSAEMADVATAKSALKHKGMDVDSYIPYNEGTLTDSKPTKLYSRNAILKDLSLKSIGYAKLKDLNWSVATGTGLFITPNSEINAVPSTENIYSDSTVFKFMGVGSASLTGTNQFYSGAANIGFRCDAASGSVDSFKTLLGESYILFELTSSSSTISQVVKDLLVEHEYDLTMPTLKSAGSVQDESKAGGEKVGKLDLGSYDYVYNANYLGNPAFYSYQTFPWIRVRDLANTNAICARYEFLPTFFSGGVYEDKTFNIAYSRNIYFRDSAYDNTSDFKASMNGVGMNVEKTTATDFSDPISYPEIFNVYAGGVVEVVGDGCDAETKVYFYVEA